MSNDNWKTVNVKLELLNDVERVLQTDVAKNIGLTNLSQFADLALREKIETMVQKRFDHINIYNDHVKIHDGNIKGGRIVSVYFGDDKAWCDFCKEDLCIHVQYAWEIPEVRKILTSLNIAPPPSKVP